MNSSKRLPHIRMLFHISVKFRTDEKEDELLSLQPVPKPSASAQESSRLCDKEWRVKDPPRESESTKDFVWETLLFFSGKREAEICGDMRVHYIYSQRSNSRCRE